VAVACVEPGRDLTSQLHVLALVLADGDLVGVVEEDVGGHQDRVGQQRGPDLLLATRFLLELEHPPGLAVAGDALQQVVQLGVLGDVRLDMNRQASGSRPAASSRVANSSVRCRTGAGS
jgi:hypothetical protein